MFYAFSGKFNSIATDKIKKKSIKIKISAFQESSVLSRDHYKFEQSNLSRSNNYHH